MKFILSLFAFHLLGLNYCTLSLPQVHTASHNASQKTLPHLGRQVPPEIKLVTKKKLIDIVNSQRLSAADKESILKVAIDLLSEVNPNIFHYQDFLRQVPVGKLKKLQGRSGKLQNFEFHKQVTEIYAKLLDGHTTYTAPDPLGATFAFLPFDVIDVYPRKSAIQFLVSLVVDETFLKDANFEVGAELLEVDGEPTQKVVELLGKLYDAPDAPVKLGLGLYLLTNRNLRRNIFPEQDEVVLKYKTTTGDVRSITMSWEYQIPRRTSKKKESATEETSSEFSWIKFKRPFHQRHTPLKSPNHTSRTRDLGIVSAEDQSEPKKKSTSINVPSTLQDHISALALTPEVGYLEVKDFSFPTDVNGSDALATVIQQLPKDRLILDLRDNPGGFALNVKILHEMLSENELHAVPFQMRASKRIEDMVRSNKLGKLAKGFISGLVSAILSARRVRARMTGPMQGIFISPFLNVFRLQDQVFSGKYVTLTNHDCYSACELFTALQIDLGASEVIGIQESTGGGFSTVVQYKDLKKLFPTVFKTRLPKGVEFSTSFQRFFRTGWNTGAISESVGVEVNAIYKRSKEDLIDDSWLLTTLDERLRESN